MLDRASRFMRFRTSYTNFECLSNVSSVTCEQWQSNTSPHPVVSVSIASKAVNFIAIPTSVLPSVYGLNSLRTPKSSRKAFDRYCDLTKSAHKFRLTLKMKGNTPDALSSVGTKAPCDGAMSPLFFDTF